MKIGIGLTNFSWPIPADQLGPTIEDIARTADTAGFHSLWVMDHFFQIRISGAPTESPMPEAYSTLGFLAGITNRIMLGALVGSVSYRHPGVLIKTVTTLDVLSGGRMYFGIGAGAPFDPPQMGPETTFEAEGLGIPFPRLAERFQLLEETLQIAHQMWSGDETPFHGKHYNLSRPLNSPNSVRRPHPPILIGGSGEKKTLRLVARYADACNLFDLPGSGFADNLTHKLEVLRGHCEDLGRDPAEIEKTVVTTVDFSNGIEPVADHLRALAELGIDHALVTPPGAWDKASLADATELLTKIGE
ncbi:TIGR03560 family F420-dependent LLM class oxidoreductase [Nocardia sp. ET3-3]|uniref:TIGR03560 family F420-dependent LLM class oxidoreductase n=1 Tax=Nocardia terrae TaxID=2675851 RepID=A0A7K1V4U3_9NOCA|nr:LLM class F420-dependent oxidoreductase [Nocardia terrae]MVU81511.1 TIGR03560 family F420-dependent LLM class oxidoreductase [Nocardia terrae]